jgi:sugar lactone lactonase YvrE
MSHIRTLLDGLGFPESTRWHDGRAWLCNWGSGEVLAVTTGGDREVIARIAPGTIPFSIDWLPDGRLLIVDGPRRRLLRQDPDASLAVVADLGGLSTGPFNAYVNGAERGVVCVGPDGGVRVVAEGFQWPNGMALVDGDRTLVMADSYAEQLIAFTVADDGSLTGRRVWAQLEHAPDGICADAEGAIWVATVPGQQCLRVREGGEVLGAVAADRGCFACMLGGEDGRTLFIGAAEWRGMDVAMTEGPGLTGQLLAAPEQPAPHAGRP